MKKETKIKRILEEGKFDKDTLNLIEGKIVFDDGTVYEGKFHKDTGHLIEGKKTFSNGVIQHGIFNKYTGNLMRGKNYIRHAFLWEGAFEDNQLIEGKATYEDVIEEGTFEKDTYRLIKGKKTYSDGTIEFVNDYAEAA